VELLSKSCSCPSVVVVTSLDALESVKVVLLNQERVRVSSSQTLSNPSIVETLSVAEFHVTDPATNCGTEDHTRKTEDDVSVEC